MRAVATVDARSVMCLSVLVTTVSPAKMAEPIELPFFGGGRLVRAQRIMY